jgi:trehalose-phosphatase
VDEVLASFPDLRKALGKKVFELRPDLDWDKGKALLWFLETLGLGGLGGLGQAGAIPVYLGDDVTDEDAFRAIAQDGIGILVSEEPRSPGSTAATYSVRDPDEARELLERLALLVEKPMERRADK